MMMRSCHKSAATRRAKKSEDAAGNPSMLHKNAIVQQEKASLLHKIPIMLHKNPSMSLF
jgi:hypothetical protein